MKAKHLPWNNFPDAAKIAVRNALLEYPTVYSTNYDLLLYWSLMHEGGAGFSDCFFAPHFDPANTEVWGKATRVFYLHGALHLYRTPLGVTLKRKAEFGANLLDLFGTPMRDDASPLFVAEGTSKDMRSTIWLHTRSRNSSS